MGKDIGKSHKHLVELMLNKQSEKQDIRFSDITLEEYQKQTRLGKMFNSLKGWTIDTDKLREDIRI